MSTQPHFSLLATSFAGGPRPRNAALILSGLWLLLFFAALFAPPLLDDADATHASAARAMATSGDLVTLHVDGVRYLEKAPLPYWLAAASFRLFGFNTFAAHLPQAVAVLLLMLLGHRWANQAFGARTGFYTAQGVLTSAGVFLFTRILIPEVLLSLFLAATLFAFLKALGPIAVQREVDTSVLAESEERERPALAWDAGSFFYPHVMWASLACAVLSKGLVALLFFFATALLFLAFTHQLASWRRLRPLTGILLLLAIAGPWHLLAGLRNQGGSDGHGFWWFYFVNEHVLRFLGRREPRDFNKLPGWAYWGGQLVWLFPWSLFLPLGGAALWRRQRHQVKILTGHLGRRHVRLWSFLLLSVMLFLRLRTKDWMHLGWVNELLLAAPALILIEIPLRRVRAGLPALPFYRIDPQQRSILLLSLFAGIVLVFFSLSTNQEYYTFPAYLPLLLLIAATITRAEQTYSSNESARRWITFAHLGLMALGGAVTLALGYGLWSSRHLPFVADIGGVLAHRGVGDYTLSTSHLFDLTTASFAALRLPAVVAMVALTLGPALAWMLRTQRRHVAATTAVGFTAAGFLLAAQLAFVRFAPLLSSRDFAGEIIGLEHAGAIALGTQVLLYGDQAFGSSLPFYLGRTVSLVDGRSTSMLFGSTFPDAPKIFLSPEDLRAAWGHGERKVLFVPPERREDVNRLLGARQILLKESSGKALITDRELAR